MGRSIRSKRNKDLRTQRRENQAVVAADHARLVEQTNKLHAVANSDGARQAVDDRASRRAALRREEAAAAGVAARPKKEKKWGALLPRVPGADGAATAMETDDALGVRGGINKKTTTKKKRGVATEEALRRAAMSVCGLEPGGVASAHAHEAGQQSQMKSSQVLLRAFSHQNTSKSSRRKANKAAKRSL